VTAALDAVLRAIAARGPIPFAEFMTIALTDPEGGYYSGRTARPVRDGDFLTAPELHPIFGATLARQLAQAWELIGRPAEFTLIEFGAGGGALALAILAGLRADGSGLADALRYAPIELNEHRLAELRDRAASAGLAVVRPAPNSVGAIVANEFLDALPVHAVEMRDGRLLEVHVAGDGAGGLREVLRPPSTPALAERLAELAPDGVALTDGQRAEICLALDDWALETARLVGRGLAVVIDYGAPAPDLYGPRRRAGTLMTYRDHAADGDPGAPYRDVGDRDMTAHVDMLTLARRLAAHGFRVHGETTQARFLAGCGLADLLERERSNVREVEAWLLTRSAVARLLDPRHLGGFRVVLASRGLPADAALMGLAWPGPG
jgi:SAM-dependent MidA family methyltransferase